MPIKGKQAHSVIIDDPLEPCSDGATVEVRRDCFQVSIISPDGSDNIESYWIERRGPGHHAIPSPVPVFEPRREAPEDGMTLEELREWLRGNNGGRPSNS